MTGQARGQSFVSEQVQRASASQREPCKASRCRGQAHHSASHAKRAGAEGRRVTARAMRSGQAQRASASQREPCGASRCRGQARPAQAMQSEQVQRASAPQREPCKASRCRGQARHSASHAERAGAEGKRHSASHAERAGAEGKRVTARAMRSEQVQRASASQHEPCGASRCKAERANVVGDAPPLETATAPGGDGRSTLLTRNGRVAEARRCGRR